jgi:hypothetical protein
MLSGTFITVSARSNFEVERTVYFVFLSSVDASQVLCSPSRLISCSVHWSICLLGLLLWKKSGYLGLGHMEFRINGLK